MKKILKAKWLMFGLAGLVPQILYCVYVYCYSQYLYAFVNRIPSNSLIFPMILVSVCVLPFLLYCLTSVIYNRILKPEKWELKFDNYRLSISWMAGLLIIGLLVYFGAGLSQHNLSKKAGDIVINYLFTHFLIGIGVCILLLFKITYHALKLRTYCKNKP